MITLQSIPILLSNKPQPHTPPYLLGMTKYSIKYSILKDRVTSTITTYEPRASLIDVYVSGDLDAGSVVVKITFFIRNEQQPISLDVILKRNR